MKFSYSGAWDDTVRMMKTNGSLLLAIAGVFFLLPALLTAYLLPAPADPNADPFAVMGEYYSANMVWLLIGSLVNAVGSIAIYLLLFDARGRTVGGALGAALPILPFYFILSAIVSMAIGMGLVLLVIPGIYLIGRLATSGAVMVAEGRRNPFSAIGGSWRLTKGKGWSVAGLVLIVGIAGAILSFAVTAVLGSVFIIVGGREGVGGLLVLILNSATTAVLYVVIIVLLAAIYRRLSPASSAEVFE